MAHPDFQPTGKPTVGQRRSYGELPRAERFGVGIVGLHEGLTLLIALRASGLCRAVAGCDLSGEKRSQALAAINSPSPRGGERGPGGEGPSAEGAPGSPAMSVRGGTVGEGEIPPGIKGFQITASYQDLLDNPEVQIVAIYTPDAFHADQIEQAMRAGKHVICTKPLINDPADIPRLKRVAEETGMRLQVGQSTRFGEPFQRQREDFEQGKFGEIEVVDAHYNHRMDWYYEKSPWTVTDTHWAYLGLSHPVDLVRWYLGEIAEVHAYGTLTALGQNYKMQSPDAIVVNLKAKSGRIGRVLGNYGAHELPAARSMIECFLMGSQGTSLARYPELRYTHHDERGIEIEEDMHHAMAGYYYRHELKGMHYGEFCNYADYFASCLLANKPNSPDLAEGLGTVQIMGAIVESLFTGLPVKLP